MEDLAGWESFFVATATVAGALVGLLFVALSLHLRTFLDEAHTDLRTDAQVNLYMYLFPFLLSLVMLVPGLDTTTFGLALVVSWAAFTAFSILAWRRFFAVRREYYATRELAGRIVRNNLGLLFLLAAGLGFVAGQRWPVYAIATVVAVTVVLAVLRSWEIIFRAARVERGP